MQQRVETMFYTLKVTPEVWKTCRENVDDTCEQVLISAIKDRTFEPLADSFKGEVMSTEFVSRNGTRMNIPGEIPEANDISILWYNVAYTMKGYEPIKLEDFEITWKS